MELMTQSWKPIDRSAEGGWMGGGWEGGRPELRDVMAAADRY